MLAVSVGGQSLDVMTENIAYGCVTPRRGGYYLGGIEENGDDNNKEESMCCFDNFFEVPFKDAFTSESENP